MSPACRPCHPCEEAVPVLAGTVVAAPRHPAPVHGDPRLRECDRPGRAGRPWAPWFADTGLLRRLPAPALDPVFDRPGEGVQRVPEGIATFSPHTAIMRRSPATGGCPGAPAA